MAFIFVVIRDAYTARNRIKNHQECTRKKYNNIL